MRCHCTDFCYSEDLRKACPRDCRHSSFYSSQFLMSNKDCLVLLILVICDMMYSKRSRSPLHIYPPANNVQYSTLSAQIRDTIAPGWAYCYDSSPHSPHPLRLPDRSLYRCGRGLTSWESSYSRAASLKRSSNESFASFAALLAMPTASNSQLINTLSRGLSVSPLRVW